MLLDTAESKSGETKGFDEIRCAGLADTLVVMKACRGPSRELDGLNKNGRMCSRRLPPSVLTLVMRGEAIESDGDCRCASFAVRQSQD